MESLMVFLQSYWPYCLALFLGLYGLASLVTTIAKGKKENTREGRDWRGNSIGHNGARGKRNLKRHLNGAA